MAEKKKGPLGATVAPPTEKADFFAQLQNTFERGVVSAEVDLSGLYSDKGGGSVVTMFGEAARYTTGPSGVSDQTIQKMKDIANTFGGKFTVHSPLQANPSHIMEVGRAEAAKMLKKSMDYTERLGANMITVHPMGQMEYYFVDPFVGTKKNVPNPFFLAKNKEELKGLMKKFKVQDPVLKEQIEKQWDNWVQVLPTQFAETFGPMSIRLMEDFSNDVASWRLSDIAIKNKGNVDKMRNDVLKLSRELSAPIARAMEQMFGEVVRNHGAIARYMDPQNRDTYKSRAEQRWHKVAMSSIDPIRKDGTEPKPSRRLVDLSNRKSLSPDEENEYRKLHKKWRQENIDVRSEAWGKTLEHSRFGPFDDSEEDIKHSVIETFRMLFKGIKDENRGKKGSRLYKALKNKKIKIGIENLFPASPERGYMQGFAYFYQPEHIAEIVKAIRKEAREQGLPEDVVTVTFDIGHAAASKHMTGLTPSQFLDKLKKAGVKPGHVHIVGGPGYGHEHVAWGDWLDEVSRMDPDVVKKLVDVGAINIEGGAGLHDVEVTLNTLWDKGLPLEAMLAMAGAPDAFTPGLLQYTGFRQSAYMEGVASSYVGAALPQRAFYSFQQEAVPLPMRGAFGGYTAPSLFGGGYAIGPGPWGSPRIWSSAQPFLYSAKKEE